MWAGTDSQRQMMTPFNLYWLSGSGISQTLTTMLALEVSFLAAAEPKVPVASLTTCAWCTKQWQNENWGVLRTPGYQQ